MEKDFTIEWLKILILTNTRLAPPVLQKDIYGGAEGVPSTIIKSEKIPKIKTTQTIALTYFDKSIFSGFL